MVAGKQRLTDDPVQTASTEMIKVLHLEDLDPNEVAVEKLCFINVGAVI